MNLFDILCCMQFDDSEDADIIIMIKSKYIIPRKTEAMSIYRALQLVLLLSLALCITEMNATKYIQGVIYGRTRKSFTNRCAVCKNALVTNVQLYDMSPTADMYNIAKCPIDETHVYHTGCFVQEQNSTKRPYGCPVCQERCEPFWAYRLWDFASTYNSKACAKYNDSGVDSLLSCIADESFSKELSNIVPQYVSLEELQDLNARIEKDAGKQALACIRPSLQKAITSETLWRTHSSLLTNKLILLPLPQLSPSYIRIKCTPEYFAGLNIIDLINILEHVFVEQPWYTDSQLPIGTAELIESYVISHGRTVTRSEIIRLIELVIQYDRMSLIVNIFKYYVRNTSFTCDEIVRISQLYIQNCKCEQSDWYFCFLFAHLMSFRVFSASEIERLKSAFVVPATGKSSNSKVTYSKAIEPVLVYERISNYTRDQKLRRLKRYFKKTDKEMIYLYYIKMTSALVGISEQDLQQLQPLFIQTYKANRALKIYSLFPSKSLDIENDLQLLTYLLRYKQYDNCKILLGILVQRKQYNFQIFKRTIEMMLTERHPGPVAEIIALSYSTVLGTATTVEIEWLFRLIVNLGYFQTIPYIDEFITGNAAYEEFIGSNIAAVMDMVAHLQGLRENTFLDLAVPKGKLEFYFKHFPAYLSKVVHHVQQPRAVQQTILEMCGNEQFKKYADTKCMSDIYAIIRSSEWHALYATSLFGTMGSISSIRALKACYGSELPGKKEGTESIEASRYRAQIFRTTPDQFQYLRNESKGFYTFLKIENTNIFNEFLDNHTETEFIEISRT